MKFQIDDQETGKKFQLEWESEFPPTQSDVGRLLKKHRLVDPPPVKSFNPAEVGPEAASARAHQALQGLPGMSRKIGDFLLNLVGMGPPQEETKLKEFSLPEMTITAPPPERLAPVNPSTLGITPTIAPTTTENDPEFEDRRLAVSRPDQILTDPYLGGVLSPMFQMFQNVPPRLQRMAELIGMDRPSFDDNPLDVPLSYDKPEPGPADDIKFLTELGHTGIETMMGSTPAGAVLGTSLQLPEKIPNEEFQQAYRTLMAPVGPEGLVDLGEASDLANIIYQGVAAAKTLPHMALPRDVVRTRGVEPAQRGDILGAEDLNVVVMPGGDKIVRAAVKIGNRMFTGLNHDEAWNKVPENLMPKTPTISSMGFTGESGKFYTRFEIQEQTGRFPMSENMIQQRPGTTGLQMGLNPRGAGKTLKKIAEKVRGVSVGNEEIRQVFKKYAADHSLPEPSPPVHVKMDPVVGRKIAEVYDKGPPDGVSEEQIFNSYKDDPVVGPVMSKHNMANYNDLLFDSYRSLSREIAEQFKALPIKVEWWTENGRADGTPKSGQPYQNSSEMFKDVKDNKTLKVFVGGEKHPLLGEEVIPERLRGNTGASYNDLLRAVHDAVHAAGGYEFGPNGEEGAWLEHSKTLSPLAQLAMTTETRGQNSWVNFKRGNESMFPQMRPYAKNELMILPRWITRTTPSEEEVAPGPKPQRLTSLEREQQKEKQFVGTMDIERLSESAALDAASKEEELGRVASRASDLIGKQTMRLGNDLSEYTISDLEQLGGILDGWNDARKEAGLKDLAKPKAVIENDRRLEAYWGMADNQLQSIVDHLRAEASDQFDKASKANRFGGPALNRRNRLREDARRIEEILLENRNRRRAEEEPSSESSPPKPSREGWVDPDALWNGRGGTPFVYDNNAGELRTGPHGETHGFFPFDEYGYYRRGKDTIEARVNDSQSKLAIWQENENIDPGKLKDMISQMLSEGQINEDTRVYLADQVSKGYSVKQIMEGADEIVGAYVFPLDQINAAMKRMMRGGEIPWVYDPKMEGVEYGAVGETHRKRWGKNLDLTKPKGRVDEGGNIVLLEFDPGDHKRQEVANSLFSLVESGKAKKDALVVWADGTNLKMKDAIGSPEGGLQMAVAPHKFLKDLAEKILEVHLVEGGSTTDPRTGEQVSKKGMAAVSPYPDRQFVVDGDPSVEQLNDFIQKNADLLSQPEHNVGTWKNKKDGKTYVDVSIVQPVQQAIQTGREKKQQAVYDFETRQDIEIPRQPTITGKYAGAINKLRLGLNDDQKKELDDVVRNLSEIAESKGEVLTNEEVVNAARMAAVRLKTVTREETLQDAAEINALRGMMEHAIKTGKVTEAESLEMATTLSSVATHYGRMLQSFKASTEALPFDVKRNLLIQMSKKVDNIKDVIAQAAEVDFNDPVAVQKFYRQFVRPTISDILSEFRYTNMLSSPRTHAVNTFSNLLQVGGAGPMIRGSQAAYDAVASKLKGRERETYMSEVPALVRGGVQALPLAFRRAADVMSGKAEIGKPDMQRFGTMGYGPELGNKWYQKLGEKFFGAMSKWNQKTGFVLKALEASDQYFRTIAEEGQRSALSERYRKSGRAIDGKTQDFINKQAANYASELVFRDNKDVQAQQQGFLKLINTGTNHLKKFRVEHPSVRWFIPFVETPMNILKRGIEYSPAGPALGSKGPEAVGKAIFGSMVLAGAGSLAWNNETTWATPKDPKKRKDFEAAGKQPYSIKLGDTWYSFSKLGPIAYPIGLAVGLKHTYQDNPENMDDSQSERLSDLLQTYATFFADQSYVRGLDEIMQVVQGDKAALTQAVTGTTRQYVPLGAMLNWTNTVLDQTKRTRSKDLPQNFVDQLKSGIPFWSTDLPEKVGPTGETEVRGDLIHNLGNISPVYASKGTEDEALRWTQEKGVFIGMPSRRVFEHDLDPVEYYIYAKAVGEKVRDEILLTKDQAIYERMTREDIQRDIDRRVSEIRSEVRNSLFKEYQQEESEKRREKGKLPLDEGE